jgi:hypothetical protein
MDKRTNIKWKKGNAILVRDCGSPLGLWEADSHIFKKPRAIVRLSALNAGRPPFISRKIFDTHFF